MITMVVNVIDIDVDIDVDLDIEIIYIYTVHAFLEGDKSESFY